MDCYRHNYCRTKSTSRANGEMFVEPTGSYFSCRHEMRCQTSRLEPRIQTKTAAFYKHFAPTALALLIATGLLFTSDTHAQRRSNSAAGIPSPRAVLGFNPGDDRTIADWKQISDYFARLDAASDRVQLQTIGKSTLGRAMFVAFISAPENIRNLEKYKAIQTTSGRSALSPLDGDVNWSGSTG